METRLRIETDKAPPSTGFRSQAMIAGGLLFTGGMIGAPLLPDGGVRAPAPTLAEQVDLCLRHLEQVTMAGGADKRQVVEVSAFLVPYAEKESVARQVADFLGHSPLLFNAHEVHDVAMHALLELDWIAVVDPDLSQAEAASWVAPLGHAPELTERGPFVILNGVTAEGATLGEQSYGVLAKAGRILSEAGSGIEHLVKMTVVIADFDSYPQFNQATQTVFADITPPTRSVVVAPHLTGAHLLRVDFLALRGP